MENKYNETPITLAIKKRGFYDSLKLLTGVGGYIQPQRIEPLKQFCVNNGYVKTAQVISQLNTEEGGPKLDMNASENYLRFQVL